MKILVTGPESSGKSTLARSLAWCLDGVYVAEEARYYLYELDRPYRQDDLDTIWQRQLEAEERALASGSSFVICDTGPEVLRVWSEVKYGSCSPLILEAVKVRRYDLVLLCYPDIPWSYDPLREAPDEAARMDLFDRYSSLLPGATVVRGTARTALALSFVDATK